jgi:hypothetical protein
VVLVAVHQHAALVVGGRADRAAHRGEPARGEPRARGVEQRGRRLGVVRALEEAEEPHPIAVELGVRRVVDGRDAAHHAPVALGEVQRRSARSQTGLRRTSSMSRTATRSGGTHCG